MSADTAATEAAIAEALGSMYTESGTSLLALAEASPVLLVFLRHFGCTFCRQAISQVAELRPELDSRGVRPVFVHLGPPHVAHATFNYYGLGDVERVDDPQAILYRHPMFMLSRTSPFSHFANPAVVAAWLKGAILRYGFGKIENDGHQMPGVFFLKGPKIVRRFVHRNISDQPDYLRLIA